jgi:bacterial/archaeal transporter family protein
MDWLYLAIASAAMLGLYDVCKKSALVDNAVLPTLWGSTFASWLLLLPLGAASLSLRAGSLPAGFTVAELSGTEHLWVLLKSAIVTSSWLLTFSAVKYLPISLAGPIRSTAPVFTLLGAVLFFAERPSLTQWCGIAIVVVGYGILALIGEAEGVGFRANGWFWVLLAGTLVGAGSGLYDKVLLQGMGLAPVTLQFWFTTYNLLIQTVVVGVMWWPRRSIQKFEWRRSVFLVGALLVLADQLYFRALASQGALLSIISLVRRSNVLVSFAIGSWLFREQLLARKATGLALIALGLVVLHL